MRICKKCGLEQPLEQFLKHSYECKGCAAIRGKRWRERNAEKHRETRARYYENNKDKIVAQINAWVKSNPEKRRAINKSFYCRLQEECITAYGGPICACCGITEPKFLTIDHTENNGSDHRREIKALGGLKLYQWLKRNGFPKGFQILCINCNQGRYRNGGICPHKQGATIIPQGSRAKRPEAPDTPRG